MPTYEYVCTDCGAPLEVVQSIHEPSLTECPACHGRLRKVFGNVGVVFKGSGFYRTDSRGTSSGAAADPAMAADAATPSTSTGTSDAAKPDAAKPDAAKPDAAPSKAAPSPSKAGAPSSS